MGRGRGVALVVSAAVLLTACGGITEAELEQEAQSRGGGLGSTLPLEAIDAIEAETGEPVILRTMSMSLNSLTIETLVPGHDDQLDSWTYRSGGNLDGPSPVTGVPNAGELRRTLVDPDRIAIDDLDELVDDAIEEADLPDGYAQSVFISRSSPDRVTISVGVTNPRETVHVDYRGNGERIEATS